MWAHIFLHLFLLCFSPLLSSYLICVFCFLPFPPPFDYFSFLFLVAAVYFGSPLKALAIMEHFSIEQLLPLPLMLMVINQVAAQRTEN